MKELCLLTLLVLAELLLVFCAAQVWENPRAASHTYSVLMENVAGGTQIYGLYASDTLKYSIVSQTPATPAFTISKNGILLSPTGGVDAENASSFVFVFSADDGSNPPVKSGSLTVTVVDEDEFTPTLTRTSYFASITEDTLVGSSVLTISASDGDATPLTYAITGGNTHDTFVIDSNGQVKVKTANLDSSTTPRYTLTITVTDGGWNTLTATVVIDVIAAGSNTAVVTNTGAKMTTGSITSTNALTKTDSINTGNSVSTDNTGVTVTYANSNIENLEQNGNKSVSVTTRINTMLVMFSAILVLAILT